MIYLIGVTKPIAILDAIKETKLTQITTRQLYNLKSRLRKAETKGKCFVNDLAAICSLRLELPENKDVVFVCNFFNNGSSIMAGCCLKINGQKMQNVRNFEKI